MGEIAAVMFDMDGVLVDSEGVRNAARREAAIETVTAFAGHCVAVEDSANGIRSAAAAQMAVIAIPNREFPPAEDVLELADDVLDALAELTPERAERLADER